MRKIHSLDSLAKIVTKFRAKRKKIIHCHPSFTPAKAKIVASAVPQPNGSRKNDPGIAISPTMKKPVAMSQIHCQAEGSINQLPGCL